MDYKFPKNFFGGGAAGAPGFEGSRENVYDVGDGGYEKEPERFGGQIGPNDTIGFIKNYKKYIQLMKEAGFNSFRFSISGSRFIDKETNEVNVEAAEIYRKIILECKENDIEPMLCLGHFDLPMHLQEKGGGLNRETIELFNDYCKKVFLQYDGLINYWFVHNEVGVHPEMGYIYDAHVPNHVNFNEMVQCAYNLLLGQAKAIETFKKTETNGIIGTILNPNPVIPRSDNKYDIEAARIADIIYEKTYLDCSINGYFSNEVIKFGNANGLTPLMEINDRGIFQNNKIQILGVNYYQPKRVKARESVPNPNAPLTPKSFYDDYVMPGREYNFSRGGEIYPKGIYDTLMRIKNEYGNILCMVTENGMGIESEENYIVNGVVQDDYRIDFYNRHLEYVNLAINDGVNCIGYHLWAPFDNGSPMNTFKNRYGLYRYNLETKEMEPKKSKDGFKIVATNNEL